MRSSPKGFGLSAFGWLMAVCILGGVFGGATARGQWQPIPSGAQWLYLANGTQPDPSWVTPGFNESGWSFGHAKLGFGDDGEVTIIGNQTNQYVTFYFRNRFLAASTSGVVRLVVRMVVDDGAVIYLNTNEVFRFNLPPGPVNSQTLATNTLGRPEELNYFSVILEPKWLREGQNVLAAEVHQATPGSSDLGFDLELTAFSELTPPSVFIFEPSSGSTYGVGSNVLVTAPVSDADSLIAGVDFKVDGVLWYTDTTSPYAFLLPNLTSGHHQITVVARDSDGLSSTSSPVAIEAIGEPGVSTLVPNGAYWRYLDNGSDQGTNWHLPGFVDLAWPIGLAEFGYGDTEDDPPRPERTLVGGGPTTNHFVTTYFRRSFDVPAPGMFTNLILRMLRDDGAVVWLNNAEVHRSNLNSTNQIHFNALATNSGTDGATYITANVNPTFLQPGRNVIAVEIHQTTAASSDISFDLMLQGQPAILGQPPVFANRPEHQNGRVGQPAVFQAVVVGEEPMNFTWSRPGGNIVGDGPTLVIPRVQQSDFGSYTLTVYNQYGSTQAVAFLCAPPIITAHPTNIVSPYGATVSFIVSAALAGGFQWFFNGVPIPGATTSTLIITNVNRSHVGVYFARANNGPCSADSRPCELQVCVTHQGAPMPGLVAVPEFSGFVPASQGNTALPMHHGIPLLFTTDNARQDLAIRCGVPTAFPKIVFYKPLVSTQEVRFSTEGSDFDTVLEVEVVTNNYVSLGCNDDGGARGTSVVTLSNLVAGRSLQVRVSGKVGSTLPSHGIVRLQIGSPFHAVYRDGARLRFSLAVPGRTNYSLRVTNRFNPFMGNDPSATWPVHWSTNAQGVPEVLQDFVVPFATPPPTSRFFGLRLGL